MHLLTLIVLKAFRICLSSELDTGQFQNESSKFPFIFVLKFYPNLSWRSFSQNNNLVLHAAFTDPFDYHSRMIVKTTDHWLHCFDPKPWPSHRSQIYFKWRQCWHSNYNAANQIEEIICRQWLGQNLLIKKSIQTHWLTVPRWKLRRLFRLLWTAVLMRASGNWNKLSSSSKTIVVKST